MLGPGRDERVLQNSKDERIRRYIDTLATIRFVLFPVNVLLLLIIAILVGIGMILDIISGMIGVTYRVLIDSAWLPVSFFGISQEEYLMEYVKQSDGTNAQV